MAMTLVARALVFFASSFFGVRRRGLGRDGAVDPGGERVADVAGQVRGCGLMPAIAHEALLDDFGPRDQGRPCRLVRNSGVNSGPGRRRPLLGSRPGNRATISWRPDVAIWSALKRVGRRCPGRTKTTSGGRSASCGCGLYVVPDDLVVGQSMPHQVEQRLEVALGLGGRAAAERAAGRHPRHLGRDLRVVHRERVEEQERRAPLLDVRGQVVDLLLGQRRRLGDEQAPKSSAIGRRARPS